MQPPRRFDRRAILAAGALAGTAGSANAAAGSNGAPAKGAAGAPGAAGATVAPAAAFGLDPASTRDQSDRLQAAIDQTAQRGVALMLPTGRIVAGGIVLRPGTRILGASSASTIACSGRGPCLTGANAPDIRIAGFTIDGTGMAPDAARASGLVQLEDCRGVILDDLAVTGAAGNAIALKRVSGHIGRCTITNAAATAIFSIDAAGLTIAANTIAGAADNGILVWRSTPGEDGTIVTGNRIGRIANRSGGTGQYGNGVNVYRAGSVMVSANRITDCAFTAVRANEAGNVQIVANHAERLGEVAIYAEAAAEHAGAPGFEGAVISDNLVDTAACGIAVTNFNNGGRLAVIQGNLVRNLFRREQEPRDKRGEGIGVEADAVVANNVIEAAPTAGLLIGWGRHMREVLATGNLIRRSRIGIAVTGDAAAGHCLIAGNMISGASEGAIRTMDHARAVGPDLASGRGVPRNLTLNGNVAV
jgi:uncharacterized secreted repeat protein (TIGR03808 family)